MPQHVFNDDVIEDQNTIPEGMRAFYAQVDGGYQLDSQNPAVAAAVANITRLNGALQSERAAHKSTRQGVHDLSPLSAYGSDPSSIASAVEAKLQELQGKVESGDKVDIDKLRTELQTAHQTQLHQRDQTEANLKNQIFELQSDYALQAAMAEQKAIGDLQPTLLLAAKQQLRQVNENGNMVTRVVDEHGNTRFSGNTGAEMTPAELIAEMKSKKEFAVFFASETPEGPGFNNNSPKPIVPTPKNANLSPVQKISRGLSQGKFKTVRQDVGP